MPSHPPTLATALSTLVAEQLPRWLSQACRDPNDAAHGCFDRNWWHYRIRDFASVILQQGGYAAHLAARLRPDGIDPEAANALAAASCRFWNTRAIRHGAFEEYYPWEQGYPPLAFSTLAVAKLAHAGIVPLADILPGLRVAARQLASRFEPKAANQQVAGLAALAWIRKIAPELATADAFEAQTLRTLALQTEEGWFWEYDGPDIGYLSVTLDCLWDLWDATQEARFRDSAFRALHFIQQCVAALGSGLGMLNARNTDYVVPYGLARCVLEGDEAQRGEASTVLGILYGDLDSPHHFLRAIDDRYWCHYIGHSVVRAALLLRDLPDVAIALPSVQDAIHLPLCGYVFRAFEDGRRVAVAARKGGALLLRAPDGSRAADYGWTVRIGKRDHVTHWWSKEWKCAVEPDGAVVVEGMLVPCKGMTSTPWMHAALRVTSLLLGRTIIGILKGAMIFRRADSPCTFRRRVECVAEGVVVHDEITGLPANAEVQRAPRASKRHVASADSFHAEDAALERGFACAVESERSGDTFRATSQWGKT